MKRRPASYVWGPLLGLSLVSGCITTGPTPKIDTSSSPHDIQQVPLAKAQKPEKKGETYFDPNHTGTALYDTHQHAGHSLGPYFTVRDFSKTGDVGFRYARIDPSIVNCLSRVRSALGKPLVIRSSYRSYAYNDQLVKEGKTASKRSYHISGKAADLTVPGVSVSTFAKTVYSRCGCGVGLGVANGWFHVDTRGTSTRPWGYGAASTTKRNTARRVHEKMCGGGGSDSNESMTKILDSVGNTFKSLTNKIKEAF